MQFILIALIGVILNQALVMVDEMIGELSSVALWPERHLTGILSGNLSGDTIVTNIGNVLLSVGISLIILKFVKKIFETYVLWTGDDPDVDPLLLVTNLFKALAVSLSFPALYGILSDIVNDITNELIGVVGSSTNDVQNLDAAAWTSGGLLTAVMGLVFVIIYFLLYFQFLMKGLEILILRVGLPLACVGLLDNNQGVFRPYMSKLFQSMVSIIVQIVLCKLGVSLMIGMQPFWGVACLVLSLKTPVVLREFMVSTSQGGGLSAASATAGNAMRFGGMAKGLLK